MDLQLEGVPYIAPDTKSKKDGIYFYYYNIVVVVAPALPEPYNLVCKLDLSETPEWLNVKL